MKRARWIIPPLLAVSLALVIALAVRSYNRNRHLADLKNALSSEDTDLRLAAVDELILCGEAAVPIVQKALADGDTSVRRRAIDALARIKGKRAAAVLAELLSDPDRNIRSRAIMALGAADRSAMPDLIRTLETEPFPRARMFAANSVAKLAAPGDAPEIARVFDRQDSATKMHLVIALVNTGDEAAYAKLGLILKSPDWKLRLYVVDTAAGNPIKKDLPLFLEAIDDDTAEVRMWAMFGLENLGLPETYPVVLAALDDDVWYIRKEAAYTLGALGNTDAVPHLIPRLEDPHPLVRGNAAESLGKLGAPALAPKLRPLLAEEAAPVQIKAAEALTRLNDYSGVENLIAMLESRRKVYRSEARKALMGLSDEDFGEDCAKWTRWWKESRKSFETSRLAGGSG